jgi:deoxyribodipyrimidine photo-lyase
VTIQEERVRRLNEADLRDGDYVLYWMQSAVRAEYNHALEHALDRANELDRRLLVCFGLTDSYPEANLRHYRFLLEGLRDAEEALKERKIKLVVRHGSPEEEALEFAEDASLVVCDRGYLRHQKAWYESLARNATCRVEQVETDVVVPVELASERREHAARTLRPRIQAHLEDFLVGLKPRRAVKQSLNMSVSGLDLSDPDAILEEMELDRSVEPVSHLYRGGNSEARRLFEGFLEGRFDSYAANRDQPQTDDVSHMSKYLHFGHVSPVYLALRARDSGGGREDVESFLEELIVRRELSMNFVNYTPDYDSYSCLPGWARETLQEHRNDRREHTYTRRQLEEAQTYDEYWNAAMREMKYTGYMHNYMRMYWGKKILEWSNTPEYAYETTLYLNNKYFLDGRDPNSYANVAWVFGQHDRGWKERPVYGKVRYMSVGGLKRKAKPDEYVAKVEERIRS